MRWIRLVLAALLSTGVVVVVGSGPALACSCVMASTTAFVANADMVVTGTLVKMQDPPLRRTMSSLDPITYTVDVDQTFKGKPISEVVFASAMDGASCGLEGMTVDRRYAFFITRGNNGFTANLCGGTAPTSSALEAKIARSTGSPVAPTNDDPRTTAPQTTAHKSTAHNSTAPDATRTDDDLPAQSAVPGWMTAMLAGGLALAIVGGLAWWRRRHTQA